MANLFKRIRHTVEADLNEILDQKEQNNPIALLNQYLRDCEKEVEKTRKLVERQYLLKQEFMKELQEAQSLATKRQHQAEIAEKAGEQELHEFAQREYLVYQERSQRLEASCANASQQLDELERKYEEMKHKLKDMHIKRMELMGKENITRAHYKMNQMLDENKLEKHAIPRYEEMENYLEKLEHHVNSSFHRHTIDAKIAKLEKDLQTKESESVSS
ncbi:PspA/IM30 family protein [Bacillus sp. 2205SS5-2]|uniref:PspA/IM30 family protein n=1 Tax=Bacillus sp. 2205SS5-2 TaxID=3109031 RepID=UPI003007830E